MTPEDQRREHRHLQELTHRNLMRLIDTELSLALTMSDLAETEAKLGDEPHARILLTKVTEAIDSVHQHMADSSLSNDENRKIEDRLQEAAKRLDAVKEEVLK